MEKLRICRFTRTSGSALLAAILLAASLLSSARACTIFVLTDSERTLFCNNEDWSNPLSRIWFVPAPEGFYSCAYVGFDNNGAEGGMNSAGLAYDWVAGFNEKWEPYTTMQPVGGRSSERMLETCATVDEAVAFYQKYREPSFRRAKILVADKFGASAIIGAHDGKLQVDRANDSRGFGYGRQTLAQMLAPSTAPGLDTGLRILRACQQKGQYATKYSSIYDLRNGNISLFLPGSNEEVKLNLADELKRGTHYYDMPQIPAQLTSAPQPALSNMRNFLREYTPAANSDPSVTENIVAVTRRCATGNMRRADFTPEFWKQLKPMKKDIRADLKAFGELMTATYVGRGEVDQKSDPQGGYRYKLEYRNAWVLEEFVFNSAGKISSARSLGVEWKHPLPL
jgi:hypothetical protein